ncbi:oligopeptide/dipeptide ABC transporter ATP-binding protein [Maritimibacter sp. UBA3975]|uniref:oligopeptide/dipeptide ABC transporter ATP-binding protein n=1 Tax=Maritimibacter sp. UBA3975 TaxID=1946833 RepID=UPI0039C9F7A4|tara:strand:- start:4321 stop:5274 length:954 start_codon:yes stop_codon:yes gene_type:complete
MNSVLEVENVTRSFAVRGQDGKPKQVQALRGVTLAVGANESVGIAGESGCGKSTLAKIMLGLDTPTSGEVRMDGAVLTGGSTRAFAREVQPIFQDPLGSLNPRRTVEQNVRLPLDAMRIGTPKERAARALDLMSKVGLPERYRHTYPSQLSGGQAQRVAIARALTPQPRVLVCDEPTSALDTSVQAQILNLLLAMRPETGISLVFITHDLIVLERMCERVVVMYLGEVVETGPTTEVLAAPRHPYTRMLWRSSLTPDPGAELPPAELGNAITPDPANIPSGCAFRTRCRHATDLCNAEAPAPQQFGNVTVACHYAAA